MLNFVTKLQNFKDFWTSKSSKIKYWFDCRMKKFCQTQNWTFINTFQCLHLIRKKVALKKLGKVSSGPNMCLNMTDGSHFKWGVQVPIYSHFAIADFSVSVSGLFSDQPIPILAMEERHYMEKHLYIYKDIILAVKIIDNYFIIPS